jgi:hypothetical protein
MSYIAATRKVSDVLAYVKRQFGDESGVQITDDDVIRWVNAGQDEIFRRNEPVKASATADLVNGTHTYTFPDDILKIQSILVNGVPVPRRSFQEGEEYVISNDPNRTSTGQPQIWYEWGGEFTFWPTPDSDLVGGIVLKYIKKPTTIVDAGDTLSIPDTYYNRLVEFVLGQAYELDENWSAATVKTEQFGTNLDSQFGQDSVQPDTYRRITVLEEDM